MVVCGFVWLCVVVVVVCGCSSFLWLCVVVVVLCGCVWL